MTTHFSGDNCAALALHPGWPIYRYNPLMERWDDLGQTRPGDRVLHLEWHAVHVPLSHVPASQHPEWVFGELWDRTGPVHAGVTLLAASCDPHLPCPTPPTAWDADSDHTAGLEHIGESDR